jgi:glycosyltransferase involved in cell wall biosynthesis
MTKRKKPKRRGNKLALPQSGADPEDAPYARARALAVSGRHAEAREAYRETESGPDRTLAALARNDRAVLDAVAGDLDEARQGFEAALGADPGCELARQNLALLGGPGVAAAAAPDRTPPSPPPRPGPRPVKVAVLSFLFNWPSTGGGNVHTAELALFLGRAGYEVRHFHVRYAPWGIGDVRDTPFPSQALEFDGRSWELAGVLAAYRRAVDAFAPDFVLVTDCWNLKPHLADAMRGYRVLLRFQALECLCPLNNVRLLALDTGWGQCPRHQLATPDECASCLHQRGRTSGGLHRAEREFAGVGTPEYHALLCRALREAEAVLVLNPLTEAVLAPYAARVRVVPWGMDPARFPPPDPDPGRPPGVPAIVFQAGLVDEPMKGYAVLHAACALLWERRRDFELVATGDPPGRVDAFTRFTGWASQADLPRLYREADLVAVPTVAQEGLSRTSVEAMASGRAVVASRIGGLPSTVADGATGLLCEPGDERDLAAKLEVLLDDPGLRGRMGRAGRRRFEEEFSWPVVVERHYRPLLGGVPAAGTA